MTGHLTMFQTVIVVSPNAERVAELLGEGPGHDEPEEHDAPPAGRSRR